MHSPTPVAFCAPFFTDQLISSQLPQSFRKRRRAVRLGLTPLVPVSLTLCPLVPVSLSPLAFLSLQFHLSTVAFAIALPPATYVSDPFSFRINTIFAKAFFQFYWAWVIQPYWARSLFIAPIKAQISASNAPKSSNILLPNKFFNSLPSQYLDVRTICSNDDHTCSLPYHFLMVDFSPIHSDSFCFLLEVSNPSSLSSDELEVQSSSWTKRNFENEQTKNL